jgi:uncharacterized MnhB-related membrane protein
MPGAADRYTRRDIIRSRIAFGLSGVVAVGAVVAFFAGDHRAAEILAGQACLTFWLVYAATKARQKKTANSSRF